jgi:hypothetical protein
MNAIYEWFFPPIYLDYYKLINNDTAGHISSYLDPLSFTQVRLANKHFYNTFTTGALQNGLLNRFKKSMRKRRRLERRPTVFIYFARGRLGTRLLRHIHKNLRQINKYVMVNLQNIEYIYRDELIMRGINRIPTLVFGRKKVVGIDRIIRALTKPRGQKKKSKQ